MELSQTELKRIQIELWVSIFGKSTSKVMVSNYSYECVFSGYTTTKTLIVHPDEVETRGIMTIDKPINDVEVHDVINLFKK